MNVLDTAINQKYSKYRLNQDADGIFVTVEEKRQNGTLYKRSVLSNKIGGKYTTRTVTTYDVLGTTVISTTVYTLSYTQAGKIEAEVVQ